MGAHGAHNRNALKYLIQENVIVSAAAPPLVNGMPHLVVGGGIIADMESRLSHTHALFQLDNEIFFASLDKAVHDSKLSNTINPFERARGGYGVYLASMGNCDRNDKWDHIIEKWKHRAQRSDGMEQRLLHWNIPWTS